MEKEKVLGWLPKNIIEAYRVAEGFWVGKPCTDVRVFYRSDPPTLEQVKENGFITEGLKPSKKGLMMKDVDFIELMEKFLIPHYAKLTKTSWAKLTLKKKEVSDEKEKKKA